MTTHARIGGVALLAFVAGFVGWFAQEAHRGSLGYADADDPAVMMAFLRAHGDLYALTGLTFVVMGVALALAVLAVHERAQRPSLALRSATLFGLVAAASFFAAGVLRIQAPGTLLHMGSLDADAGLAGYVAVQMAGTQGFASTGGFALSVWALGVSLALSLRGPWPRALLWLAPLPAAHLLTGLLGPVGLLPELLYAVYIVALFGVQAWCATLGVVMLRGAPPA